MYRYDDDNDDATPSVTSWPPSSCTTFAPSLTLSTLSALAGINLERGRGWHQRLRSFIINGGAVLLLLLLFVGAEKRIRDHCTNEPWTTSLSQKENIARNRLACQCLLLQSERESYILVVGSLGLNCNGKDIENNVHWFTLYYSLSQEKTSARPVPSRAYPVILCCTKANCALLCYPRHPTTRTVHHYLLTSTNDNATGQRQRIKPGILVAHSAKERSHWGVSDSVVLVYIYSSVGAAAVQQRMYSIN